MNPDTNLTDRSHLRELVERARSPWQIERRPESPYTIFDVQGREITTVFGFGANDTAALIVAAVNALPAPLDTADEAKRLREENLRLREGLEPFVQHWQKWMDDTDATDDGSYNHPDAAEMSVFARVTFGDLRRARTLLKGSNNG